MPMEKIVEIEDGKSVLEAAIENDIPMQHACGGFCSCSTCHVKVVEGMDRVSAQEEDERDTIELADDLTDVSRLGCQTKIHGDITVEIVNLE